MAYCGWTAVPCEMSWVVEACAPRWVLQRVIVVEEAELRSRDWWKGWWEAGHTEEEVAKTMAASAMGKSGPRDRNREILADQQKFYWFQLTDYEIMSLVEWLTIKMTLAWWRCKVAFSLDPSLMYILPLRGHKHKLIFTSSTHREVLTMIWSWISAHLLNLSSMSALVQICC